jgi:hypothetical protein
VRAPLSGEHGPRTTNARLDAGLPPQQERLSTRILSRHRRTICRNRPLSSLTESSGTSFGRERQVGFVTRRRRSAAHGL